MSGIKHQYKPLPPKVRLGKSDIDGHGIIADEYLPANTYIGITHIEGADPKHFHNGLYRTPLGGYLNHSPNPNCILLPDAIGKLYWFLYTSEAVQIGDELCVDYALYRCGYKEECNEEQCED